MIKIRYCCSVAASVLLVCLFPSNSEGAWYTFAKHPKGFCGSGYYHRCSYSLSTCGICYCRPAGAPNPPPVCNGRQVVRSVSLSDRPTQTAQPRKELIPVDPDNRFGNAPIHRQLQV